jgi:hypothetical protein
VPVEVGAALLSDSAHHLDHATEHSTHIRHQLHAAPWYSPAWQTVTFYYWSYFLSLSLTRLTGLTGIFLTRDLASSLSSLANARIHSGPWTLQCRPVSSSAHQQVELRKPARTRLHDLVWFLWLETINGCVNEVDPDERDPLHSRSER